MSTDPNNLTPEQFRRSYRAANVLEAQRVAGRARLDAEAEHLTTPDEIEAIVATRDFRWTDGPVTSWDLSRYSKNPTVLDNHDDRALPVGSADVRVDERGNLVARVRFARTERARQIAALVRDGTMKGFSPRFLHRRDGSAELIEISAVAVPRDPNALVTRTDAIPPWRFDVASAAVAYIDDDDRADARPFIDPAGEPCLCAVDRKGRPCGCFRTGAINKRSGPKGLRIPCSPNDTNTNERKRTMNHDSNDNDDTIAKARARRDQLARDAWKTTTETAHVDAEDDPEGIAARRARRDQLAANAWKGER